MKRIATVLVFVLGSIIALNAQDDNSKGKEMTGIICNADNVTQAGGMSTCDENKGGKSADWVFIEDTGKATKIANPENLKGMHGKVKVKCDMKKDETKGMNMMWIYNVEHIPAGI